MRRTILSAVTALALLAPMAAATAGPPSGRGAVRPSGPMSIELAALGTYDSGVFDESAAEIVAHDPTTQRLFVVNADDGVLDVLDVSDPTAPVKASTIAAAGIDAIDGTTTDADAVVNSVAVQNGIVAVAVEAGVKTDPGWVALFDTDGTAITAVPAGALPDMLTFTPDGDWLLVANEGEPGDDYEVDPAGSVTVVDVSGPIDTLTAQDVHTAGFEAWDPAGDRTLDEQVRIFGPEDRDGSDDTAPLPSENLEPEYIVTDEDSRTAYVVLQENNAMAVLDIGSARVTEIWPFGAKDHLLPGNELDPSDRDAGIAIANWPVRGLYHPDGFAGYRFRGETYLVTANEGDGRDYAAYSEEARVKDLGEDGLPPLCEGADRFDGFVADRDDIADVDALLEDENLGRLTITTADGLRADGSCFEELYAFGARSFSIWTADGHQVYDSGSDFETIIAGLIDDGDLPLDAFNANNDENGSFESRSDNKGPESEAVAIGKVRGRTYAFVGLERIGGIMVYDITDPRAPFHVEYLTTRDFGVEAQLDDGSANPEVGDLGPEGVIFIEAGDSPSGRPLLAIGNEVSGTTTLFDVAAVEPGRGGARH